MKTKVKRLSKRSLAVFLGVLMLVTSIGIGSLITANAWDTSGKNKFYYRFNSTDSFSSATTNSDGYADFEVPNDCTIEYYIYADYGGSKIYKNKDNQTVPNGDDTNNYYAKNANDGGNFSKSIKAGRYYIKYEQFYDNGYTLEYKFVRKKQPYMVI